MADLARALSTVAASTRGPWSGVRVAAHAAERDVTTSIRAAVAVTPSRFVNSHIRNGAR
ncbi:MAG: hypothetical protein M3443_20730 [Actinomycetota bacterium]|nr:hypothetical protein [Actinomycetota bacterium]